MSGWVLAWNEEKNARLRAVCGVAFEDIEIAIEAGALLDDFLHPDQSRYPGQRILAVEVRDYVFLVPYVTGDGVRFLKTIYPSRKAQRLCRGDER